MHASKIINSDSFVVVSVDIILHNRHRVRHTKTICVFFNIILLALCIS